MHTYLIALLFVCVYISCLNVSVRLSVCLCVFTWQKIDHVGGPETFKTLFGLKSHLHK